MVEGLVSSVLSSLNSMIQSELSSAMSCRQQLEDLSSAFKSMTSVVNDAEKRQRKDESLRVWLEKLKGLAYDVEDLLDEWKVEAFRYENEESRDQSLLKRVCNSALRSLNVDETVDELGFNVKLGREMGKRLKYVRERLERISFEKSNFHLEESMDRSSEIMERKTTSLIDPEEIIGRTPDKERIIPWLISETSSSVDDNLPIIAIFGLGGVGKTALAQLIYNDERVEKHFTKRIWVHVSSRFDVFRICKAITEAAQGRVAPKYSEWEMVQNHLRNVLKGKQFLLVLDDVWNEDREKWDDLVRPLKSGAHGSKILITAQNESIGKAVIISRMHQLCPLGVSDSLSLFNSIAFEGVNAQDRMEFEEIGKEIAGKCDGLPLIIKRIGRAMRFRRTKREWELVLESDTWDLLTVRRDIALELQVCYDNMPLHLRRCFAFCLMFPKDHVIEKDMLIKLWMAHGFLPSEESEEMELMGDRYFYDLMRRSLFEDPETDYSGNISYCKMKDIVHDFFKIIMSECYNMNVIITKHFPPKNARHLFFKNSDGLLVILEASLKAKNFRTLLFVGWSHSFVTLLPNIFFENLRCLRVLDLSGMKISILPDSFKNLKLLRYLNLSATCINLLPESISEMSLLQTLKLNECHLLCELPKKICKLTRLRHLEIIGTPNLKVLPHGIGGLTSLRTLSKFIVGDGTERGIGELKDLNFLQGELTIMQLERVPNVDEAREAELMNKKNIRHLKLFYNGQSRDEGVFECLQPHKNLEELQIFGYKGLKFPNWLRDTVLTSLVNVSLVNCDMCSELPALGKLPSLKCLTIEGMAHVRSIGPGIYGRTDASVGLAFPKLEKLVLRRMLYLEEAFSQELSSLLELHIVDCPMLKAMPILVHPKLWKLEIESLEYLHGYMPWLKSESIECLSVKGLKVDYADLPNLKYLVVKRSTFFEAAARQLGKFPQLYTIHIDGWMERKWPLPQPMLIAVRRLKLINWPHVEQWCGRGGVYWHMISHIPDIWFGKQQIQKAGCYRAQ